MTNKATENLDPAELPLTGSELVHIVQGGNSRKTELQDLLAVGSLVESTATGPSGEGTGAATHDRWRVNILTNQGNTSCILAEVQFRTVPGVPQLVGPGSAFTNSVLGGNGAANAFDDNPGTYWHTNAVKPGIIGWTFSDPIAVSEVAITLRGDSNGVNAAPVNFDVEWSDDAGATWHVAWGVIGAGFTSLGQTMVFTDPAAGATVEYYPTTLTALNDIDLPTTPEDGQVLVWNDTTNKWQAGDQSGGTGGGGGGVVFSGALINRAANLALVAATDTTATFDTENYDTDEYYDAAAPTRLTVPTGVTRVQLAAQLNGASATGQLYAEIWKNGATFVGAPIADTDTLGGDGINLVSAPINVVPGDYFQLRVFSETARNVTFWMSVRAVDGALVTPTSGSGSGSGRYAGKMTRLNKSVNQDVGVATWTPVSFDIETKDELNAHDNVTNNHRITIPAGVTRANFTAHVVWVGAETGFRYWGLAKNGTGETSIFQAQYVDPAWESGTTLTTGWIDVTPGDYFCVLANCSVGQDIMALANATGGQTNKGTFFSAEFDDGTAGGGGGSGGGSGGGLFDVSMGVPDLADFTAVGATYATYSENPGLGINIKNTSSVGAASTLLGLTKPIPAPTFHVCSLQLPQVSRLDFWRPVMGVFNSANGRFETVSMNIDSSTNGQIERASWTAYDNRSSFAAVDGPRAIGPFWMHVKYDGTNIFFGYSFDGANPFWAFTRVLADWIGAITDIFVGMFALTSGALNGQNNTILCWDEDGDARVMGVAQGGGGGSSPYTPPLIADFPTPYNIASNCQTADTAEGLAFTVEASATTINRGLLKAAPAAPYSVTWKQRASFSSNAADDVIGIVIRDSATDRLITWGPNVISNLVLQRWNSATSYSGNVIQTGNAVVSDMCFRLVDDGTNFLFQIGPTVEGPWITWRTESRTTWCANPNQIGINIEEQSGHGHYFQVMEHWAEA